MITLMGKFLIPISIYLIYRLDCKKAILLGYFLSIFTTLSIANIDLLEYSLTIGHFWLILLGIKVLYFLFIKKYSFIFKQIINIWLIGFLVYAAISISIPLFLNGKISVISPNGVEETLKFSIQNITQLVYLMFGGYVFFLTSIIIRNEKITLIEIDKVLRCSLLIIVLLCFIQILVPFPIYDMFFRNDFNHATHYLNSNNTILRMSGPFIENSMLALYITPVFCYLCIKLLYKFDKFDFGLAITILFIGLFSKSSTFILALGVFIIILLLLILYVYHKERNLFIEKYNTIKSSLLDMYSKIKRNKKSFYIFIIVSILILSLLTIFIIFNFKNLIIKLLGEGESGYLRNLNFEMNMNIFLKYPITGIGFGSTRSGDLFTTWLSQVGIVGFSLFIFFIYSILKNLIVIKEKYKIGMFFIIVITLAIQMFSVPEPYYPFIWIYYSIAFNINLLRE